jgi:phosphoglycerol transferase MdoB-like AlkP superfamily enzyme
VSYDKINTDGSVVTAPAFTRRVLDSAPVIFQIAEWLIVIVAFQYVDARFASMPAKIVGLTLSVIMAIYVGVLTSNVAWRFFEDPFKNRLWNFLMYVILPCLSGGLVFFLLRVVAKQMVAAQS